MPESEWNTLDDVLAELDRIVESTLERNSPLGVFAWVYRRTTAGIVEAIARGEFQDPERMERFDLLFARRYLVAFRKYRNGDPVSRSWRVAFEAAEAGDRVILQHLLLGMNAHINLDLGIAAATVAPGAEIESLRDDFHKVNDILASLVDEMQNRLSRVSPLMILLDWIGRGADEAVVNFSITRAREHAWRVARELAEAGPGRQEAIISRVDGNIADLGEIISDPPGRILGKTLAVIRWFEEKNYRRAIRRLKA